jgi:signal transduction histidine kinase
MDPGTSLRKFHKVVFLQGLATLVVLAAVVLTALLLFRKEIHFQILHRDGALLTSVSQHFYEKQKATTGTDFVEVLLESSELAGVIAVRLYSTSGEPASEIPIDLHPTRLSKEDLQSIGKLEPIVRHTKAFPLNSLFSDLSALLSDESYPVTEVLVPIVNKKGELIAILQFWLDGEGMAAELAGLDRFLILLGTAFLIIGSCIYLLVLLVSRKRILKMGIELADRNLSLQKANSELAMAARTSAIGSISSHLFHGLKNPLAGLKSYLQLAGHDEEAVAITNQMQQMIDESLSVIREDSTSKTVNVTLSELESLARKRFASKAGQSLTLTASGEGEISIQKAQLLLLVIGNLLDNAMEAAPGLPVSVSVSMEDNRLVAQVEDNGPGLPEEVKAHLFEPVASLKENGTGVGLALSAMIARHIPATLELRQSNESGSTFVIEMPL